MPDKFVKNGMGYGTIECWAEGMGQPPETIRERLKKEKGITGNLEDGTELKDGFYSELQVGKYCGDLIPGFQTEMVHFLRHMPMTDDITLIVLKGHLLIEQQLDSIIKAVVAHADLIDEIDFGFEARMRLARAMCWSEQNSNMWPVISKLNTLRNDLAHSLDSPALEKKQTDFRSAYIESLDGRSERDKAKNKAMPELLKDGIIYIMGFLGSFAKDAQGFHEFVESWRTTLNPTPKTPAKE